MPDHFTVPFEERETTINIDYDSKAAQIFSSDPKTAKNLLSMATDRSDEAVVDFCSPSGIQITVPLTWIHIKPPRKYSAKEKAARLQQLAQARPIRQKLED